MFGSGAESGISYVAESVFNQTPVSPSMLPFRAREGVTLDLTKQNLESTELRDDRQIAISRHGNKQVGGDLPFELSYGSFDDFIEAVLMGNWGASATVTGSDLDANNSDNSINASSSDLSILEAGDEITISGFTDPDNNGTFVVDSVTASKIVVSGGTLVTEAAGNSVTITSTRSLCKAGTTSRSFTVERRHSDINSFPRYTGCTMNTMSLSIAPNAMVTGSFGVVGAGMVADQPSLGSPAAALSTDPFDSFNGTLEEGGSSIAVVTSLELNLDNGINPLFVVGSSDAANVDRGRSNLTGTLSAYFQNLDLIQKFVNEVESSLKLVIADPAGNEHRIIMPRVKYNGASFPVNNEQALTINMPFQALLDPTEGSQVIWERKPAT